MTAFPSFFYIEEQKDIAVGLSGGPDSMALTHMLCAYAKEHKLPITIHALTINHNLREDSLEEAQLVESRVANYPHLKHHIINWTHEDTNSRIMETARKARYQMMEHYCKQHDIQDLYIAHHQDDQVETFLFRLSKGSGLDGLCGMQEKYKYSDHLNIIRPLLEHPKEALIEYCNANNVPYIQDPTNEKTKYARPRLRKSREALEQEGLTPKRISTTAKRLSRAKDTLIWLTEKAIAETFEVSRNSIEINVSLLSEYPQEIHVRALQHAIAFFNPELEYSARMEKIEKIAEDAFKEKSFRKQTFANIIFEKKLHKGMFKLALTKEA